VVKVRTTPRALLSGALRATGRGLVVLLVTVLLWYLTPRDGFWPFCQRLYTNGQILTLDPDNQVVTSLYSSCGRITWTGDTGEAQRQVQWNTRVIDLQGRTVVPGFIDAHSHFPLSGLTEVTVDLSPPPSGSTTTLPGLYRKLRQHIELSDSTGWVLGFNYDNTVFANGQHPERRALDDISTDRPIFLRHNSGHMGVANTRALELLGVLSDDDYLQNPLVRKYPGTDEPDGLLRESAAPTLARFIDALDWIDLWRIFRAAKDRYAAAGFTTVQAGGVDQRTAKVLLSLSASRLLPLRLVVWPTHDDESFQAGLLPALMNSWWQTGYAVVGPVKLYGDGSPQGYTAYLSTPYHDVLENEPGFRGYPVYTVPEWISLLRFYLTRDIPLAIHTNGDAAIDDVLVALSRVRAQLPASQRLPVTLVHAQTMRRDQVALAAALGIDVSFFVSHTWFWGDWHATRSLGPERASRISPLRWAEDAGLRYTLHTDAPVTPPSAMQLLWSAVERKTRSGRVLGPELRVSRLSALRALTVDAAAQAGLDKSGSLVPGRNTDMLVLSDNPLTADNVREIDILQTIVGGRVVYRATTTQQ